MTNITSGMILCVLLNYHIICVFSAAQIRFPAKPENYSSETQVQSAMSDESNRRMRKLPNSVFDGRKSRRVMLK
ncbi:hypothetical protein FVA45_23090 [Escherichia coli]|nr:hypothetical protein [Escherichia coli]EAA5676968.1 hypothetical protein [Escherichia coli]EEZ0171254.1 hypothetical protein [Escherichia coli]EFD5260640.1 hypothetical protein [Escherichia coli]EGE2447565.1 hypothetical protein [Escherichia coli]